MTAQAKTMHTAGPWTVSPSGSVVADPKGWSVASLMRKDVAHGDDERRANAALIAAAPALYEACRRAMQLSASAGPDEIFDEIRAALKLAQGE